MVQFFLSCDVLQADFSKDELKKPISFTSIRCDFLMLKLIFFTIFHVSKSIIPTQINKCK
jgi:hypothetical protein